MKARITVCVLPNGSFEILLNEAGRDLMVQELQRLDRSWEHFHLDHYDDPDMVDATDVPLSAIAYRKDDTILKNGKVLLRPDDWDQQYFPHILKQTAANEN